MVAKKTTNTNSKTKEKTKTINEEKEFQLTLTDVQLYSINGQHLLSEPTTKEPVKLGRQNSVDIIEINENVLKLRLSERLFFTPEGPFKLDLEVIGTYESDTPIESEEINNRLDIIAKPLFSYASLVISFISERFATIPIIVPPTKTKEHE